MSILNVYINQWSVSVYANPYFSIWGFSISLSHYYKAYRLGGCRGCVPKSISGLSQPDDEGFSHHCCRCEFNPSPVWLSVRPSGGRPSSNLRMVMGFLRAVSGVLPPYCWPFVGLSIWFFFFSAKHKEKKEIVISKEVFRNHSPLLILYFLLVKHFNNIHR